jgi:hypothetical protein
LHISIKTTKRYKQRLGVQEFENLLQKESFSMHFLSSAPQFLEGERPVLGSFKTRLLFLICYIDDYATELEVKK